MRKLFQFYFHTTNIVLLSPPSDVERDELLPGEPDSGRPHHGRPQLHPLLHLHARQVRRARINIYTHPTRLNYALSSRFYGISTTKKFSTPRILEALDCVVLIESLFEMIVNYDIEIG